ncbi:hypothetical protein ANCCAN_29155 [Ancylostoma caninum]|uniref:UBC core domain-containing protein n=1 Tax=Ancylostoma caninum TaxID=29170 RepID=A0A368EZ99_ANCCA|nr:hypothetical protein ANCCAN_29155 [Ancylostoma caninum]
MVASVTATARLKKDYAKLLKEPVPFVRAAPLQENILEWHYIIFGAPNTPYEVTASLSYPEGAKYLSCSLFWEGWVVCITAN